LLQTDELPMVITGGISIATDDVTLDVVQVFTDAIKE
jgi:hypothetical protein